MILRVSMPTCAFCADFVCLRQRNVMNRYRDDEKAAGEPRADHDVGR